MRGQGILGESEMGDGGGMGSWVGMVGHQRWENHINKGDGIGKVQTRCPR